MFYIMDDTEIAKRIESIMDCFGMTGVKAAEIMGMSQPAFKQKKAGRNNNRFSAANLNDLVNYITAEADKLRV